MAKTCPIIAGGITAETELSPSFAKVIHSSISFPVSGCASQRRQKLTANKFPHTLRVCRRGMDPWSDGLRDCFMEPCQSTDDRKESGQCEGCYKSWLFQLAGLVFTPRDSDKNAQHVSS